MLWGEGKFLNFSLLIMLMDYDSCRPFGTLLVWAPPYFSSSSSSIMSSLINFRIINCMDIAVSSGLNLNDA